MELRSTLQLPPGDWTTILDCLCARFPGVSRDQWLARFRRGRILDVHGNALAADQAHRAGLAIHYFREVDFEEPIPFEARILHVDEHLVVVDKPHFLPVTPAGRFVKETLLWRLIDKLGNPNLAPLHRIDRGTAGLVMFSARPESRDRYQSMFRQRVVDKRYEALAPALPGVCFPLVRKSRIARGEPFFRMREYDGPPNSESEIEVLEQGDACWRYALRPVTGRKHQLRVHMAALGAGILNDPLYPGLAPVAQDAFEHPLKLLARGLSFVDPISGERRQFESRLTL